MQMMRCITEKKNQEYGEKKRTEKKKLNKQKKKREKNSWSALNGRQLSLSLIRSRGQILENHSLFLSSSSQAYLFDTFFCVFFIMPNAMRTNKNAECIEMGFWVQEARLTDCTNLPNAWIAMANASRKKSDRLLIKIDKRWKETMPMCMIIE